MEGGLAENLAYMSRTYGFFVPFVEHVTVPCRSILHPLNERSCRASWNAARRVPHVHARNVASADT